MSRAIVEVTIVLEMYDGGSVTSLDQLAAVAATLVNSPTAHAWLVNSSIRPGAVRSGETSLGLASTVNPPEG